MDLRGAKLKERKNQDNMKKALFFLLIICIMFNVVSGLSAAAAETVPERESGFWDDVILIKMEAADEDDLIRASLKYIPTEHLQVDQALMDDMTRLDEYSEKMKAFFTKSNQSFVQTLPEGVIVRYICENAPVLSIKATKQTLKTLAEDQRICKIHGRSLLFMDMSQNPGKEDNQTAAYTSSDARAVLRAAARLVELTDEEFARADADRDGHITSTDARLILRVAARL